MYQADTFTKLYQYVERKTVDGTLPVSVLGVADADGLIALKSFGNKKDNVPVKADDIFSIFSITKPIVGLCIAQLWEQGKINIEAPVKNYISEWNDAHRDVRVWHLMCHVSGVSQSYINEYMAGLRSSVRHRELFDSVVHSNLADKPGTVVEYNNMAFTVLAELITRISGIPYDEYILKHILQPLSMSNTGFAVEPEKYDRLVEIVANEQFLSCFDSFVSAKFPAGGLFSTAEDLLKLGRCCLNGGSLDGKHIVSPLTLTAMLQPYTGGLSSRCEPGVEFGLTWNRPLGRKCLINKEIYGHNGMSGCMFWVYPNQGITFVLMTNKINLPFDNSSIHNVLSSCL